MAISTLPFPDVHAPSERGSLPPPCALPVVHPPLGPLINLVPNAAPLPFDMASTPEGAPAPVDGGGLRLLLSARGAVGDGGQRGASSSMAVRRGHDPSQGNAGGSATNRVTERRSDSVDQPRRAPLASCAGAAENGADHEEPGAADVADDAVGGTLRVVGVSGTEATTAEKTSKDGVASPRKTCAACGRRDRRPHNWGSKPPLARVRSMIKHLEAEVKVVCTSHADDDSLAVADRQQLTPLRVDQAEVIAGLLGSALDLAQGALDRATHDRTAMNRAVAACENMGASPARESMLEVDGEGPIRRLRKRRFRDE